MEEWRVVMYVTEILAGRCFEEIDTGALDDLYFSGMCQHLGYDPERILATTPQRGSERILELAIRSGPYRSEEHTSELQSLMRISYAVFCLKKKKQKLNINTHLLYRAI